METDRRVLAYAVFAVAYGFLVWSALALLFWAIPVGGYTVYGSLLLGIIDILRGTGQLGVYVDEKAIRAVPLLINLPASLLFASFFLLLSYKAARLAVPSMRGKYLSGLEIKRRAGRSPFSRSPGKFLAKALWLPVFLSLLLAGVCVGESYIPSFVRPYLVLAVGTLKVLLAAGLAFCPFRAFLLFLRHCPEKA